MHEKKMKVLAGSVQKLLRRGAFGHAVNLLAKLRPADISTILLELRPIEQHSAFSALMKADRRLAAAALNDLGEERGLIILKNLSVPEIAKLLQDLETDDRATFVSALPSELASEVLERMRIEQSVEVQGLLQYEEETAGRIMTPNVFSLREELTVAEAIHTIQTTQDLEMIFYLYVIDDRGHLVGVVSLRQLLTVSPSTPLKKIMMTDLVAVTTDTDQEEVAHKVALYNFLAIPVVDHENKLMGVITVDDVIDVIKDEATEDILHLAGVDAADHIHTPARRSVRRRLPWLGVNLITALLAATVIAFYEPTIAALPVLAIFLPVVAGMGGNSGTQTLTLIVRSLALGEVTWKNSKGVLVKEMIVGLSMGLVLGIAAAAAAVLWKGNPLLGVVLGTAMVVNMFVACVAGTIVPLTLEWLRIDPAIASGIFLTTFTDLIGFFAFLGLAALLLI